MNTENIVSRYNSYISVMQENAKRITNEQTRAYHGAFIAKKEIEKTTYDLGYMFIYGADCLAVDLVEIEV